LKCIRYLLTIKHQIGGRLTRGSETLQSNTALPNKGYKALRAPFIVDFLFFNPAIPIEKE
jgi:hypothetical protein